MQKLLIFNSKNKTKQNKTKKTPPCGLVQISSSKPWTTAAQSAPALPNTAHTAVMTKVIRTTFWQSSSPSGSYLVSSTEGQLSRECLLFPCQQLQRRERQLRAFLLTVLPSMAKRRLRHLPEERTKWQKRPGTLNYLSQKATLSTWK